MWRCPQRQRHGAKRNPAPAIALSTTPDDSRTSTTLPGRLRRTLYSTVADVGVEDGIVRTARRTLLW
jgi:hypothetical protein